LTDENDFFMCVILSLVSECQLESDIPSDLTTRSLLTIGPIEHECLDISTKS